MPLPLQTIDDERREVRLHRRSSPASNDINLITIRAGLKAVYDGRYAWALSRSLKVSRGTVWRWFSVAPISAAKEPLLREHVRRLIDHLVAVDRALTASIDGRARSPKRQYGFLAVKDHGDGLGPHDNRLQTLQALGLRKRADVSKG